MKLWPIIRNTFSALLLLLSAGGLKGQPIPYEWALGHPYTSKVDAAFPLNQDYIGIISGRNIRFEPMVRSFDIVPTEAVLDPGLFPTQFASKPISDVISVNDTVALFFKGSTFVPIHKYTLSPLGNASTWTGLPGLWSNEIDAACEWGNGAYCFIKGLQYVLYDPNRRTYGTPQLLNRMAGWPTTWTAGIDAAFNGGDGYLYFVRQGMILAYDAQSLSPAPGEPRPLAGQNMNAVHVVPADAQATLSKTIGTGNGAGSKNAPVYDPEVPWCAVGDIVKFSDLNSRNTPKETADFGMPGGKEFKDWTPPYSRISEIRVWGTGPLTAIQIVAVSKKGDVTEGDIHGEAWGNPDVFVLRQDECIKGVQGTFGGPAGDYIYTLQFVTTERKSQVFGEFNGKRGTKDFKIEIYLEDALTGLKVRASKYLHSIALQYRTYGLLTIDGNGVPHEYVLGDSINKPIEDPNKPKDPWFDNHKDMSGSTTVLTGFAMPMYQWLLKSVDYTKVDPFKTDDAASFPRSPISPRISEKRGGTKNDWFLPYGWSSKSTISQSGFSSEGVEMYTRFADFSSSNSISAGGGFEIPNVVAGSANYSQKITNSGSIGTETVVAFTKETKIFGTATLELSWIDENTGQAKRQWLVPDFRTDIEKLSPRPDEFVTIPKVPTSAMKKGGLLPPAIQKYRAQYQALIDKWGTHFINEVQYGGYFVKHMTLTKQQAISGTITEQAIAASLQVGSMAGRDKSEAQKAASKGGGEATAGVGSTNESSTGSSSSVSKVSTFSTGSGGSTEYSQWDARLSSEPGLVKFKLYSLADVVDTIFFPFDKNIMVKQQLLDIFIRQYLVDKDMAPNNSNQIVCKWKEEEHGANPDAAKKVRISVSVVSFEVNNIGDDCMSEDRDPDWFGNLQIGAFKGNNSSRLGGLPIWSASKDNTVEYDPGVKQKLSGKTFSFEIPATDLEKIKLKVYGSLSDNDVWGGKCETKALYDSEIYNAASSGLNVTQPGDDGFVEIPLGSAWKVHCTVSYEE